MKNISKKLALPLALGLLVASCSAQQSGDQINDGSSRESLTQKVSVNLSQEKQNVEALLTNYSSLINAKDLAAMEAFVLLDGTDFTIFEGKGNNIGWTDYRDNHLAPEFANQDLVFTKYEFKDYRTNVSGDLASATFAIDMAYNYKGKNSSMTRNGTAILKNINGVWKIAHLHTS